MKRKEGDRVQHYQRNYGVMVRESVLNTDVEKRNIFVHMHAHTHNNTTNIYSCRQLSLQITCAKMRKLHVSVICSS